MDSLVEHALNELGIVFDVFLCWIKGSLGTGELDGGAVSDGGLKRGLFGVVEWRPEENNGNRLIVNPPFRRPAFML